MSLRSKREYLRAVHTRYRQAPRNAKSQILDKVCARSERTPPPSHPDRVLRVLSPRTNASLARQGLSKGQLPAGSCRFAKSVASTIDTSVERRKLPADPLIRTPRREPFSVPSAIHRRPTVDASTRDRADNLSPAWAVILAKSGSPRRGVRRRFGEGQGVIGRIEDAAARCDQNARTNDLIRLHDATPEAIRDYARRWWSWGSASMGSRRRTIPSPCPSRPGR